MKVRLPDKDTTGIDLTRTDYIELRMLIAIEAMKLFMTLCGEDDVQTIAFKSFRMADEMIKANNN